MRFVEEGHLRFEFGPDWEHVEQWDKTTEFKDGIHRMQGVRALDIIALSKAKKECLLIEVKDFRDQNDDEDATLKQRRGRNERRGSGKRTEDPSTTQVVSELTEQVAHKVVGTVAGLVGIARNCRPGYAGDFTGYLAAHKSEGLKVRVVLWVEGRPTSEGRSSRAKSNLGVLTQALKRRVSWLTVRPVAVLSTASGPSAIPGVRVVDCR